MSLSTATKILLFSILFAAATAASAYEAPRVTQTKPPEPKSAIFNGNSFFYNNSMHGHPRNIISAADKKQSFRGTSVTISRSGLDWHNVEACFQPNGIWLDNTDFSIVQFAHLKQEDLDEPP